MNAGKMIGLFLLAMVLIPAFIAASPFIMLEFFQFVTNAGTFGGLLLLSPFLIAGFFLIRFIVRKAKSAYDKLTDKSDWRKSSARKSAENMRK